MEPLVFTESEKRLIRKACLAFKYNLENVKVDELKEPYKTKLKLNYTPEFMAETNKMAIQVLDIIYKKPERITRQQPNFISLLLDYLESSPAEDEEPERKKLIAKVNLWLRQKSSKGKD